MSTATHTRTTANTGQQIAKLVGVVLISFTFVAASVFPQLTARLSGDDYQLRVEPLDPIDPFRGAYVALAYPDLRRTADEQAAIGAMNDEQNGDVYITLVQDGDFWKSGEFTRTRPEDGPYLSCSDRDFDISCGIESWFLPQGDALELEEAVANGTAIATVRVDGRGNAALINVSRTGD